LAKIFLKSQHRSQARIAKRKEYFKAIDKDGKGHITFNDWLEYAFQHIVEKVRVLLRAVFYVKGG
jgi:Ca2+-binding EF-hand superfamily protein